MTHSTTEQAYKSESSTQYTGLLTLNEYNTYYVHTKFVYQHMRNAICLETYFVLTPCWLVPWGKKSDASISPEKDSMAASYSETSLHCWLKEWQAGSPFLYNPNGRVLKIMVYFKTLWHRFDWLNKQSVIVRSSFNLVLGPWKYVFIFFLLLGR